MLVKDKSKEATASGATDAPQYRAAARNMRRPEDKMFIRMATLNVGTLSGRSAEVVDFMKRRRCRILCVQETKWKSDRARMVGDGFKLIHAGGDGKSDGVGVILESDLVEKVCRTERWNGRILMVWLAIGSRKLCVMSVYAPQVGRSQRERKEFREKVEELLQLVEEDEILCLAGDFNAHIGQRMQGEEKCVGKFGCGQRNSEGNEWVQLIERNGMAIVQTFFQKRESHKITYRSGDHKTEIDWLVMKQNQKWRVKDCKVLAGEHVTTQHKPQLWTLKYSERQDQKRIGRRVIRWWRCTGKSQEEFEGEIQEAFRNLSANPASIEEEWKLFKETFIAAAEKVVGRTNGKNGGRRKKQWWWNEDVRQATKEKRAAWKAVENERGDTKQKEDLTRKYREMKNHAKKVVARARQEAEQRLYESIENDRGRKQIYRLAKAREREEKDVVAPQGIRNRDGVVVTSQQLVLSAWKAYFQDLLNREGHRVCEMPCSVRRAEEEKEVKEEEVMAALKKMKTGKSAGKDEITIEMMRAAGKAGVGWLTRLFNLCYGQGEIPEDWRLGMIVPIWKGKGSRQDPEKYRGITILSQVLKVMERIIDRRLRAQAEHEIGEEQLGFRKGRSTSDGMFAVRQKMEKAIERGDNVAIGFVDLEKAYDSVPRALVAATLRWRDVREKEVVLVEKMYERTRASVVVGNESSEEFKIKTGLRQGSALSPFLFVLIMELVSRKSDEDDALNKIMYADDLAVVATDARELQDKLEKWARNFQHHGLSINLEKTEVMWVGKESKSMSVTVEGVQLKQMALFKYLGGMVTGDGRCEVEVRRRIQAGVGAYRKVAGVVSDRRIDKKIRRKVLEVCVLPAVTYGLETLALTKEQHKKLQVCENNWLRRLCGVKLVERRRLSEMRTEVGMRRTVTQKIVGKRLAWAGHVARMSGERLPRRVEQKEEGGTRGRGRPKIRWSDCVRSRRAEEGWRDWRSDAMDREQWRKTVNKVVDAWRY